jgi:hypothetical protein
MDEAGRELLGLLDGLPLALAQAASYIRETGLDTASYVRLYKQQWDDLMRCDGESGSPLVDYEQGSVATTWTVSFKAVEAQNKNAANLLRLWAFVDSRDLWRGLLQAAAEAVSRCVPVFRKCGFLARWGGLVEVGRPLPPLPSLPPLNPSFAARRFGNELILAPAFLALSGKAGPTLRSLLCHGSHRHRSFRWVVPSCRPGCCGFRILSMWVPAR